MNLVAPLQKALATLEKEQQRIERQITVVQAALDALGGKGKPTPAVPTAPPQVVKRPVSAAARRAVSQRMTAYWAKRRAEAGKGNA